LQGEKSQAKMENNVFVLTEEHFQEVIDEGDIFVLFYVPWCEHCKALKPIWESLGTLHNTRSSSTTSIAKVLLA